MDLEPIWNWAIDEFVGHTMRRRTTAGAPVPLTDSTSRPQPATIERIDDVLQEQIAVSDFANRPTELRKPRILESARHYAATFAAPAWASTAKRATNIVRASSGDQVSMRSGNGSTSAYPCQPGRVAHWGS